MKKTLQETHDTMKEMLQEIKWSNKALIWVIATNLLIVIAVITTVIMTR